MTRPPRAALAALALVAILGSPVAAHADLASASPEPDGTVPGTPTQVVVTFTQDLDPARSSLELRDASGSTVAEGGQLGAGPRELRLTVPALAPGRYEVRWTSWSAEDNEGHRGTYAFTVVAASPTPMRTAQSAPSAEPPASDPATRVPSVTASADTSSPSVTAAPSPAPQPASDAGSVAVPILVSVLALVGLGGWLLRRRGA